MKNQNYSKQRTALLLAINSTTKHPSAENLFYLVKKDCPHLSLATVYRNLTIFKQEGIVVSLGKIGGSERFDGNIKPHSHFICQQCGLITDYEDSFMPTLSAIQNNIVAIGKVDKYEVNLYGTCIKCLNKK
jgi:Fur family peroxide stress response transcriptional regulator